MTPDYLTSDSQAARLYDNIQATMPGVLLEVIRMELWNAIEEFALRSTYYRARAPWAMSPYVREYDFNPFDGSQVAFQVLKVLGLPIYSVNPPAILVDGSAGIQAARSGMALLALKPVSFGCDLPDDLFNRWFECMMDGTKARLMAHPARPYSNPSMAEYHMKRYRVGINLARAEAEQLNSGQSNFRFPYFSSGRRKN
jgi:hypothetical protein